MPQESVMKCANPTCNHSIGLVSHRRGLFGKRPYCEAVPRPHRGRAGAEARTRNHLFRMAVHAAGESAAENGGRGGSRQGALR
jgi:hypothetical protein